MAMVASTSSSRQLLAGFGCSLGQVPFLQGVFGSRRPSSLSISRSSCRCENILSFKIVERRMTRVGSGPSSVSFGMSATAVGPELSRRGRHRRIFITSALPADTYWITVFQAVGVSVLMALAAVVSGVAINIGIEVNAVKEFAELEKQGLINEEDYMLVPDEDFGSFENEEDLYIFTNKDMTGNRATRNRPVREAELQEVPNDQ